MVLMTRIQKNIFNSMYNFILPSINLWLFADASRFTYKLQNKFKL